MFEDIREETTSAEAPPFDYIEDAVAAPVAALAPLDDDALGRGGLVPVRAYVRTRHSAAAERSARQREKREQAGQRQCNVTAPANEDARAALKGLARAMSAGLVDPAEVASLAARATGATDAGPKPGRAAKPADPFAADIARLREVLVRGGLRARVLRWLA